MSEHEPLSVRAVLREIPLPRLPLRISERRVLLLVMDVLAVNAAVFVALWLWALRRPTTTFSIDFALSEARWFVLLSILWLTVAHLNDFYNLKVAANPLSSGLCLVRITLIVLLVYLMIYFFSAPKSLPRVVVLFYAVVSLPLLALWRALYAVVFTMPQFQQRALVVGAGWAGRTIVEAIREYSPAEYRIVGYVDDDPHKQQQVVAGLPVLGTRETLAEIVRREEVAEIILAVTHTLHGDLFQALIDCSDWGVQITPMTTLYEQLTGRVAVEHIGNNWLLDLPINGKATLNPYPALKRAIELIFSLTGLALSLPLLPLIALAIYLDCPGPIFYRQERLGRGGKPFRVIKLRSMIPDAEKGEAQWAQENDSRVTRVGRFLRRTRLDEIPQLINVLRGEMSLIGPRPERPEFVTQLEKQIPFYRTRLRVRPGLTGWAQVKYRYGNSVDDALIKLQYDLYYIKHQSVYLDLLILLKTIGVVLSFSGT